MPKMPKEKSPYAPLFFLIIIGVGFIIGAFVGISTDTAKNENGKFDFKLMKPPPISFSVLIDNLKNDESNAKKGSMTGGMAVALIIAQLTLNTKRYHRKGEEYGSAHWGMLSEKKKLADKGIIVGKRKVWRFLLFPHKVEIDVKKPYILFDMLPFETDERSD
jgi:type IV secretion system protein VirD4